ncbi:hypothetical protein ACF1BS_03360 [Streptomyces sp. NPDC014748]
MTELRVPADDFKVGDRVLIADKLGLVTRNGEYEVWVADVAHTNRNHEK